MINDISPKSKNRAALFLVLIAFIASIIFLCLPAYHFNATVYTNKASNTVKGDATYNASLQATQAEQKRLENAGYEVTFSEAFEEKTLSTGKVNSTLTMTLKTNFERSGFSFLGAGLTSSWILLAILLLVLLSIACIAAGLAGTSDVLWAGLYGKAKAFRTAACALLLIAILLVPIFFMSNTYAFSRQVFLFENNLKDCANASGFYEKLDYFLFDGFAGSNINSYAKSLEYSATGWGWAVLPSIIVMLLGALQIRYGAIKHSLVRILLYLFICVVCIITLYPYYVMLVTGFRSSAETNDMFFLHIFPTKWIWSNMKDILNRGVLRYLLNSMLIAGGATIIALVCGIPAAYSMARMRYKGRKVFLGFVIMSQMFSPVVLLIGISQLMRTLNLNDSLLGLMFINAAFNQAFAIWLLRGTFISISPEMEHAARIDGCTTLGSLIHILLPMAAPGIVTTLIFIFINAWNEYTISTVLISTATNRPITVGITQFSSFNMIEWQYLFAASLLATIPVVILFMCIEKHLADGLTSGGVKG